MIHNQSVNQGVCVEIEGSSCQCSEVRSSLEMLSKWMKKMLSIDTDKWFMRKKIEPYITTIAIVHVAGDVRTNLVRQKLVQMEFSRLLVAGRARQLFLACTLVCFLKSNSWKQYSPMLFLQFLLFTSRSDTWGSKLEAFKVGFNRPTQSLFLYCWNRQARLLLSSSHNAGFTLHIHGFWRWVLFSPTLRQLNASRSIIASAWASAPSSYG